MPKGITTRIPKEQQYIDDESLFCDDPHIISCYNHFKERYFERFTVPNKPNSPNDSKLSYRNYWNIWIVNLRGYFLYFDTDGRMIRLVGDYIKDDTLYKVVYTKNTNLNIFVPLTVVEIKDQKKRLRLYKRALLMKRKKMKINQIHNIYTFMGIMLLDNKLLTTSPDYFKEKSLLFFGKLGKSKFIEFSKPKHWNIADDFWKKYLKNWKIDDNDFEIINIINFLLNVRPPFDDKNKSDVFKYFEKFIGDIETIPDCDLSCHAHFKITAYLNKNINFNNRFFKLKILEKL